MVTEIVGVITGFAEAFWTVIVDGLTELTTAFYDDGSLTFLGTILFIGLGLFLVMFVVNWIRKLISK
jgi:hypothetical protein